MTSLNRNVAFSLYQCAGHGGSQYTPSELACYPTHPLRTYTVLFLVTFVLNKSVQPRCVSAGVHAQCYMAMIIKQFFKSSLFAKSWFVCHGTSSGDMFYFLRLIFPVSLHISDASSVPPNSCFGCLDVPPSERTAAFQSLRYAIMSLLVQR